MHDHDRSQRGSPGMGRLATTILALAFSATALAQSNDKGLVQLEANKARLNNATGESVYTGDVRLTRGETVITGDRLNLYTNNNGEIERAVVTGQPATYKGQPDPEKKTVRAEAPRMIYHAGEDERVRMVNGAILWQGKDRLEGETVVYRVQEDTVEVDSGDGRVNITITPSAGTE